MKKLYINDNMLFKDKLPQDLYTAFQIIKLLIEKENLNLIHNKNSYQHFNCLSRKENSINYIMRCNSWTTKPDFTYLHYIHHITYLSTSLYTRNNKKIDT